MPAPRCKSSPEQEFLLLSRNGHRSPPSTSDTILAAEVEHLERDLTEFSLSSMSERPLIPREEKPEKSVSLPQRVITGGSNVRPMTPEELEKWHNKQNREHKKADNLLFEVKRKESFASSEELDTSLM